MEQRKSNSVLALSTVYFARCFEGGMSNVGKRSEPASASRKRKVDRERVEPSRVGELDRPSERVRKLETRLSTIFDKLGQGVCLFDGSRRLVMANAQYAELYGIAPEAIRPGMLVREIVSLRIAAGSLPKSAQDDFLEWRDHVVAANKPSELGRRTLQRPHNSHPS